MTCAHHVKHDSASLVAAHGRAAGRISIRSGLGFGTWPGAERVGSCRRQLACRDTDASTSIATTIGHGVIGPVDDPAPDLAADVTLTGQVGSRAPLRAIDDAGCPGGGGIKSKRPQNVV